MRVMAAILCAGVLAGCMSTSPEQWAVSTDDRSRERAIYECKYEADATMRQMAAFGGVIVPMAALFKGPRMFDDCMRARGYDRAP